MNEVGDTHVSAMEFGRKSFEVVSGTKTRVQLGRVLDPVP